MSLDTVRFISLLSTALALSVALAHLLELPNKMELAREDYLTVQQLYRGWAFAGIFVIVAPLSTLVLAFMVRNERNVFILTFIALLCIVGTQLVFWRFTYPVNRQTSNWTVLPANWAELRRRWEYSHATAAVLDSIAVATLILSVLARVE